MFSLRTRRWWLALPLLLVLAVVLHTAIWRAMAARMEQGVAVWTAERRVLGWGVQHAPAVRGGWPLSVRLRLPGFELVGGPRTTPSSLHWRAEALELRVAMLDWDTLLVSPRGLQRLEVDGQEFPFAADRMELSLPLEGGRTPREGALEVERLRLNSPLGPFELRRGSLSARSRLSATEAEPALSVELDLRELALPAAGPGALGAQVRQAAIEASLSGPLPPVRHLTQRAETWRDAGGTLELRRIELQWGPVTASLSATGTLDDALQPMGAGQIGRAHV